MVNIKTGLRTSLAEAVRNKTRARATPLPQQAVRFAPLEFTISDAVRSTVADPQSYVQVTTDQWMVEITEASVVRDKELERTR
jgi:hypothetical protein